MSEKPSISTYGDRGQTMLLLAIALSEMRGIRSKQEVLSHILASDYLLLREDDWQPYQSQSEFKWHTAVAWARKDMVERQLMTPDVGRDLWELTEKGFEIAQRLPGLARSGKIDVRRCYLWSIKFKQKLLPTFQPSSEDTPRPKTSAERDAEIQEFLKHL